MHIIRERFTEELEQAAGKDASSMISAVMFGQKDEMDEEVLEEFQKNGTAHILAVSGLHIGIIYGFISLVWRGRKKLAYFCVVTAFFICYMAMASFTPSVVRAVIMVGLHLVANITNRRYDLDVYKRQGYAYTVFGNVRRMLHYDRIVDAGLRAG